MLTRLNDIRCKEVVNLSDGACLGCVSDMELDTTTASLVSLVIFGRLKLFGLLGREDDMIIPWADIEVIGEDTILVRIKDHRRKRNKKSGFFWG